MKTLLTIAIALVTLPLVGQTSAEISDIAKIKAEGFQQSQARQLLTELTETYGPRLSNSRQYLKAANWVKTSLEKWGVKNVQLENYCNDCTGWQVNSFDVEMIEPVYMKVNAYPNAWTQGSDDVKEAEVIHVKTSDVESMKKQYAGKLKDKIVLLGEIPTSNMYFDPLSVRYTEEQLQKASESIVPNPENPFGISSHGTPLEKLMDEFQAHFDDMNKQYEFLKREGAVAIMETVATRYPGIVHPGGSYNYKKDDPKSIPIFAVSPEHFGRLARLSSRSINTRIRFHLNSELYLEPQNSVNILGEIPGTDPKLKNEIVMIGGHFDSWHGGTGATDNGSGCVVMMEVMRILKAVNISTKRTIRIALWGGEEQGFVGSLGYASKHFGAMDQKPYKKEAEQISAYFNLDNGCGAVRGIYIEGNEATRSMFGSMLSEFEYIGANTVTIESTNYTDHDVFNAYGIPGFQFIQDRLNYMTVTHHTVLDMIDYVPEDDLKKSAVVIASLVYKIANLDNKLPRK